MNTNKEIIIERIQNYLYSFYAKDLKTARSNEIYDCLCRYLMEIIGKSWVSSKRIKEGYEIYILSFEYLPGRFLENIIYKLDLEEEIRAALKEMGFSYEEILDFDLNPDLGIGDMGMGSSYLISALTNQKIKATAYALRYESGNFKQIIEDGMQKELSSSWLRNGSNWEHKKSFTNILDIYGKEHKVVTYDMPVISEDASFINTLRLFKSEPTSDININMFSHGDILNAYDDYVNNSSITEFLYVDDSTYEGKILRLKQEYFFSASAMRDFVRRFILYYDDVRKINKMTNVIINDIHPTLALVEFIRILTKEYDFSIKEAIRYTREIFYHLVFSITDDSLERYPIDEIRKLNRNLFDTMLEIQNELIKEGKFEAFISDGFVEFKKINMSLSHDYIFLSKILAENRYEKKKFPFINFGTDRIIYAKSANPRLNDLFKSYQIDISKYESVKQLKKHKNDQEFLEKLEEIKLANKKQLISYLNLEDEDINPYSIFDMQLTIMHESKRQILNALAIAYEYFYLRENRNAYFIPKTYIFSGRANEGYFIAKETIKFILALKKLIEADKEISDKIKIIFVENITVKDLRILYPACDIYSNFNHPLLDNYNSDIINTGLNMSNILTTRGGISQNLDSKANFYQVGESYEKIYQLKTNNSYHANDFIYQNKIVKYTTDCLLNESYANFPYNFKVLFDEILMYNDSFNVFYDLESLISIRKEISNDYLNLEKWVNNEITNLIWANEFNLNNFMKRMRNFDR